MKKNDDQVSDDEEAESAHSFPKSIQQNQSINLEKYSEFFKEVITENLLTQNEEELHNNNISFNLSKDQQEVCITTINQEANSQIIRLIVSFSYFMFDITLLNLMEKSKCFDSLNVIGSGSFSRVFECHHHKKFAIKSILYNQENFADKKKEEKIQKNLRNSIFEYCLFKLFSCLKIGPHLSLDFGFDMIIYSNAVEFAMEVCSKFKEENIDGLVSSLKFMHSLKIIHGDIKPENLMWSPTFNKNIFVDFGMSQFLKEDIGFNTFTKFFGTYNFCGDEMKKLFYCDNFGYVDLYYNDAEGLKKVFEEERIEIQFDNPKGTSQVHGEILKHGENQYRNFLCNIELLQLIYMRDFKKIDKFVERNSGIYIIELVSNIISEFDVDLHFSHILKLLVDAYGIKKVKKKVFTKEELKTLEMRIQNVELEFNGTIHDIMIFFKICMHEDITPHALMRKRYLQNYIQTLEPENPELWEALVEFSINPYSKTEDFVEVFGEIRKKLKMTCCEKINCEEFKIFQQGFEISTIVLERYKINLFSIYTKTCESRYINGYNRIEISHLLQNHTKSKNFQPTQSFERRLTEIISTKSLLSNKHKPAKTEVIFLDSDIGTEEVRKLVLELTKEYNFSYFPKPLFLFLKTLEMNEMNYKNFSKAKMTEYLNYFNNFWPAQNTYLLSSYRDGLLMKGKETLNPESFFHSLREHYKCTNIFCFDLFRNIQSYFYNIFFSTELKEERLENFIKVDFSKFIEKTMKFGNVSRYIFTFLDVFTKFVYFRFEKAQEKFARMVYDKVIEFLATLNYEICTLDISILSKLFFNYNRKLVSISKPLIKSLIDIIDTQTSTSKQTEEEMLELKIVKNRMMRSHSLVNNLEEERSLVQEIIDLIKKMKPKNFQFYSTTIEVYSEKIINSGQLKIDDEDSVISLVNFITESEKLNISFNYLPFSFKAIAFYYSCRPYSEFPQYFSILLRIVQKCTLQSEFDDNFSCFVCMNIIVEKYLLKKTETIQEWHEIMYESIKNEAVNNPFFFQKNSDIIQVIRIIFNKFLQCTTLFTKAEFMFYLRSASYSINYCRDYTKRNFILTLSAEIILFLKSKLFECNRKKFQCLYLRSIRTCFDLPEHNYSSPKHQQKDHAAWSLFEEKMQRLLINKKETENLEMISNISGSFLVLYNAFVNRECSYEEMAKVHQIYSFTTSKNN